MQAVPRRSLHFHDSIFQQQWGTWFASVQARSWCSISACRSQQWPSRSSSGRKAVFPRGCMRRFQLAAKRAGATSGTLDQGRLCEPGVQFHRQGLAAECACLACCQTTGLHQGRLLRRRLHGDPAGSDVVVVVLTDASVYAEVVEFATAMRSLQLEGPNSRMSPFFSSTGSPCIGMASWPSARPSDVA